MVSVIIPAKNEEEYLGRCLQSVADIDHPADLIEVIVVDNGSTDETASLAGGFEAKVISSNAPTIGALRNEGAQYAKGEILAFIDADIMVDRDWLKNAVVHFEKDGVGAVGSHPLPDADNITLVESLWDRMGRIPVSKTRRANYLRTGNLIVKTVLFNQIGGFDNTLKTCEDAEFGFRFQRLAEIIDDKLIRVTHLRNPKTFTDFFIKEFWHAKGLLNGLFKYSTSIKALPSLALPVVYLAIWLALIISPFLSFKAFMLLGLATLLLPFLYCIRSCLRSGDFSHFAGFCYMHLLYLIARSSSFAASLAGEIIMRTRIFNR